MVTSRLNASSGQIYRSQVIFVGEPAVGKSAIVESICNDGTSFLKNYTPTAGIEFRQKMFNLPSTADSVELLFLDSGGLDVYENLNKKTWSQNSLFCLVYDVTRKVTFEKLSKWSDLVQPFAIKGFQGIILANKVDLSNRRIVSDSYGRDFAQKNRLTYYECSAKENVGIHDVFMNMAQDVCRKAGGGR